MLVDGGQGERRRLGGRDQVRGVDAVAGQAVAEGRPEAVPAKARKHCGLSAEARCRDGDVGRAAAQRRAQQAIACGHEIDHLFSDYDDHGAHPPEAGRQVACGVGSSVGDGTDGGYVTAFIAADGTAVGQIAAAD